MSSIGTRFPQFPLRTLGIKRTPSMPPSPSPSEISLARPTPDLVILLPEDNPIQQKLMTKQLERAAKAKKRTIRIDFAKTFNEARNAIITRAQTRGKKYDALLTDNQMKDDTSGELKENVGVDLIEWIKKHPKVEPTSRAMYSADNVKEKVRLNNLVHRFFKKTESKEAAERVVGGAIAAKPLGTEIQTTSDVQSPKSKRSMESLTALFGQPSGGSRITLNRSNTGDVGSSSSMHSGFDTSPLPSPTFARQASGLSQDIRE